MKILLIDDDEALGEALTMYLDGFQHRLICATRPSLAFELLIAEQPDMILLDIMLPEQDGLSVCREIRRSKAGYCDVPIIMLTARGDVTDRVVGLEIGADDYLPKPFEPRELLARISSVMRRQRPPESHETTRGVQCGTTSPPRAVHRHTQSPSLARWSSLPNHG
ncbi:MAG TPA: hypothetical protein DD979_12815, partial [Gammaproteobacteria bacterium]|jgi:OmpR family response regulator RpaB|nr:hypothetical protein [Gammaproteobacteria bacterium]